MQLVDTVDGAGEAEGVDSLAVSEGGKHKNNNNLNHRVLHCSYSRFAPRLPNKRGRVKGFLSSFLMGIGRTHTHTHTHTHKHTHNHMFHLHNFRMFRWNTSSLAFFFLFFFLRAKKGQETPRTLTHLHTGRKTKRLF